MTIIKPFVFGFFYILSSWVIGQRTEENIDIKVKFLDNLYQNNELDSLELQDLHACGGITAYYFNDELNLIKTVYYAEVGFIKEFFYLSRGSLIKVVRFEHSADWENHLKNYPEEAENDVYDHMTYNDSIFEIYFTNKLITYAVISEDKILQKSNDRLIKELNWCIGKLIPEVELIRSLDLRNTTRTYNIEHSINSGFTEVISYSEKSACGGSLKGYFRNDSIMKIDGIIGGELESYERKVIYFIDNYPIRMTYQQHVPDWNSFDERTQKSVNDFSQMKYSDTTYYIEFYSDMIPIYKIYEGHFEQVNDSDFRSYLLDCISSMTKELSTERR